MVTVAKQSAAAGLYNELVNLAVDDAERAGQIEWSLRAISRRNPADVETRIAVVQAAMQRGSATDALADADSAWPMRHQASGKVLATFQAQLIGLGKYEQADDLHAMLPQGTLRRDEELTRENIVAWNLGDLGRIEAVAGLDTGYASLLRRLRIEHLTTHLAAHQRIVRDGLRGQQLGTGVMLTNGDDGPNASPELAQSFFVNSEYAARMILEETVHAALEAYYSTQDLANSPFWEIMTPMVMGLAARPAFRNP